MATFLDTTTRINISQRTKILLKDAQIKFHLNVDDMLQKALKHYIDTQPAHPA